jgi:hypothetical protein
VKLMSHYTIPDYKVPEYNEVEEDILATILEV